MVADTVPAIEEYLEIGNPEQPSCKEISEEISSPHTDKIVQALMAQSEIMVTMMT